jgi:hypothetical protein
MDLEGAFHFSMMRGAPMLGVNIEIRDHFFGCLHLINNWDELERWSHLQDYIHEWVWNLGGLEFGGGDFADYASSLPLIYAKYLDDPSVLDLEPINDRPRIERRPSGRIDLDRFSALCFSRRWWKQQVFERQSCSCPDQ